MKNVIFPAHFTAEECQQFTFLNLLAYDIARKEAGKGKSAPFLSMTEDAKAKYRQKALDFLNEKSANVFKKNETDAEEYIAKFLKADLMQQWIDEEAELKHPLH